MLTISLARDEPVNRKSSKETAKEKIIFHIFSNLKEILQFLPELNIAKDNMFIQFDFTLTYKNFIQTNLCVFESRCNVLKYLKLDIKNNAFSIKPEQR